MKVPHLPSAPEIHKLILCALLFYLFLQGSINPNQLLSAICVDGVRPAHPVEEVGGDQPRPPMPKTPPWSTPEGQVRPYPWQPDRGKGTPSQP